MVCISYHKFVHIYNLVNQLFAFKNFLFVDKKDLHGKSALSLMYEFSDPEEKEAREVSSLRQYDISK